MKYSELIERAKAVKLFTIAVFNINNSGRLDHYIKIVNELAIAHDTNTVDKLASKYRLADVGFALKELYELVYILEFAQKQLQTIRKEEIKLFKEKLKKILSGPPMTQNETSQNSHARNYQFELRIAAKFYEASYNNISYGSGHDLVIKIRGRKYAIECKRVTTGKTDVIIKRTNEAIEQLEDNKNYYAGFIALDITQKFEGGTNWITSSTRDNATNFVSNEISKLMDEIYDRNAKIKKAAQNETIVMIIGNLSCAFLIEKNRDLGWFQQSMFFLLSENNKSQVNYTKSDISKLDINDKNQFPIT